MKGYRGVKRMVEFPRHLQGRFAALSKSDWAEAFADLYRQMSGECDEPAYEAIMADAERRVELLRLMRKNQ